MSKLYQCPYTKKKGCSLELPCIKCEDFNEYLNLPQNEAPKVSKHEQPKEVCVCLLPSTTFLETNWCTYCRKPIKY